MRRSRLPFLLTLLILLASACSIFPMPSVLPAAQRPDTMSILAGLDGIPCLEAEFICVTLNLPLDYRHPDDGRVIGVTFAVRPAEGERRGMFVTAVGGPGASGLAAAVSYTAAFDPAIRQHFDIVFFDQRGVGASGGLQCPHAAAAYYQSEGDPHTAEGEALLITAAQTFAAACTAEMGRLDWLPYLGTDQAIEDLERFRQAMGDEQFWLYGESYGTQFAQTYAAAYPQHLAGLILDGPVDLTLSGIDYLAEQAAAFDTVLQMTLAACNADPACAADMGGEAIAAYDALAARLKQNPADFEFPTGNGWAARRFTFGDLETAAAGYLYAESSRMILLRALAAASSRNDFVPLARILYEVLSLDPATQQPVTDPAFSDAVYYSVECRDYGFGPPEAYLAAGDSLEASLPRFLSVFYTDLPCVFWPAPSPDRGRPASLAASGIPTLVLVGTADPATPPANAERIVSRLADGYLVVEQGGAHVIFGWGNACVDDLVTNFLVEASLPERRTSCPGMVSAPYLSLAPLDAADFPDPLAALASAEDEIFFLPEYYYWDGKTETTIGCPAGGSLTFGPSDIGESWRFDNCAFGRGFVLTGSGVYDYTRADLTLRLQVSGLADGELVYTHDLVGDQRAVTGIYDRQEINLDR
jgi:pimeloyl-ACP methyl ester carboxylesterase